MRQSTTTLYVSTFMAMAMLIDCSQEETCAVLHFYNTDQEVINVFEDSFTKVTFGMNVSATCDPTNQSYKIAVNTRTNSGSLEYDGTIVFWKDICTDTLKTSVRCINQAGPAELYRRFNRSHVAIEWKWKVKDVQSGQFETTQKELKLSVFYPPRVTSLTVDGYDTSGNFLLGEGQEVNIFCLFDKGYPPQSFFLLDENGNRLNAFRDGQRLNYSLRVQCKDDWPTIQCVGSNSEKNKSVSFIVKCRPQFLSKVPNVVEGAKYDSWIFNIKAHTREMKKCFLTCLSFGENSNTEVSCVVTGDPPELLLIIHLDKQESAKGSNWALILQNERGSSDTLYFNIASRNIIPARRARNVHYGIDRTRTST